MIIMKITTTSIEAFKATIILNLNLVETGRKPLRAKIIGELKEAESLEAINDTLKKNIDIASPTGTLYFDSLFNTWARSNLRQALKEEYFLLSKFIVNEEKRQLSKEALKKHNECDLIIDPVIRSIVPSESKPKQEAYLDQINERFELILETAPIHRFDIDKVNNLLGKNKIELERELKGHSEESEYDQELEQRKTLFTLRVDQFNCINSFIYKIETDHIYHQLLPDDTFGCSIEREEKLKNMIKNMQMGEDISERRSDRNYLAVTILRDFVIANPKDRTNLDWLTEKVLLLTQSTLNKSDLIKTIEAPAPAQYSFSI